MSCQVDLDTRFGKMVSLLVSTLTSLAGDDDGTAVGCWPTTPSASTPSNVDSILRPSNSASPLQLLEAEDEVPADGQARIRWIERKLHEHSLLISDLSEYKAEESTLEQERRKVPAFWSSHLRAFLTLFVAVFEVPLHSYK